MTKALMSDLQMVENGLVLFGIRGVMRNGVLCFTHPYEGEYDSRSSAEIPSIIMDFVDGILDDDSFGEINFFKMSPTVCLPLYVAGIITPQHVASAWKSPEMIIFDKVLFEAEDGEMEVDIQVLPYYPLHFNVFDVNGKVMFQEPCIVQYQ